MSTFSDQIRIAAGCQPAEPAESPVGDFGIGKGATCAYRPPPPVGMNARIRAAVVERSERRAELEVMFGD